MLSIASNGQIRRDVDAKGRPASSKVSPPDTAKRSVEKEKPKPNKPILEK